MKNTDEKKTEALEDTLNAPFQRDDTLLNLAWGMSFYAGMDDCLSLLVLR